MLFSVASSGWCAGFCSEAADCLLDPRGVYAGDRGGQLDVRVGRGHIHREDVIAGDPDRPRYPRFREPETVFGLHARDAHGNAQIRDVVTELFVEVQPAGEVGVRVVQGVVRRGGGCLPRSTCPGGRREHHVAIDHACGHVDAVPGAQTGIAVATAG